MKRALMSTRVLIFIISVALLVDSVASISYADDALVLPKGSMKAAIPIFADLASATRFIAA